MQSSINKLFCYNDDIHERQFKEYEASRKDRYRFKEYLRSQGQAPSHGSEEKILTREEWLSSHYGYADDATSAPPQPPQRRSSRRQHTSSHPSYAEGSDEE